jgi:hypothetical protein
VVGVVRRPYPSASDRRFAVVPRTGSDLRIGGPADDPGSGPSSGPGSGSGSGGAGGGGTAGGSGGSAGGGGSSAAGPPNGSAGPDGSWIDVDLVALDEHVGQRVRVGGLVAGLESDGFRLDDGTAVGRIVLDGAAAGQLASLAVGDALAVVGSVERRESAGRQEPLVVVDDPAAVLRAGDPVPDPNTGLDPAAGAAAASGDPGVDQRTATLVDPAVPEVGAAGIVLIGLASLAVTLLRRRRSRRRLAATVAARLDALVGVRRPALAPAEATTSTAEPAGPSR